jgi:hypothetical protein
VLNRALQEWAFARSRTVTYVNKGMNCDTEMYSAIKAEFEIPEDKSTHADVELLNQLRSADKVDYYYYVTLLFSSLDFSFLFIYTILLLLADVM